MRSRPLLAALCCALGLAVPRPGAAARMFRTIKALACTRPVEALVGRGTRAR